VKPVIRPFRPALLAAGAFLIACLLLPAVALASAPAPTGKTSARGRGVKSLQLVLPLVADDSGLAQFAQAVSTPGSSVYGQYESIAQLSARFGASPRTRRLVTGYLRRAGAKDVRVDATGLFADATLRSGKAQKLFSTELEHVETAHTSGYTMPAAKPSIPAALHGLVTGVVGLDTQAIAATPDSGSSSTGGSGISGGTSATTSTTTTTGTGTTTTPSTTEPSGYAPATGTAKGCATGRAVGGFTPNQFLTAYDYNGLHDEHMQGQGERVALIEIDGFKASDISHFAKCFDLHVPPIHPFGVGVSHNLPAGGEATLDIEVLDAAAPYLKGIDVYESRPDAADVLKALTEPLQHAGYQPQVISASLGLCESQTVDAVGKGGIKATNAALEEATASGISVLAASGDSGSADCVKGIDSSSSSANSISRQLAVNFPASSDWVTSVGGTNLSLTGTNTIQSSVVWNDTTVEPGDASGGGYSSLFPRPRYQNGVVKQNRRAVPDVALLADIAPGYAVYCTATPDCENSHLTTAWQTVGGTSAATPLLAGGFAVLDQILRIHKQQSLGLANPLLYKLGRNTSSAAQVFYDVTQGTNDVGPYLKAGAAPLGCCTATTGYDEATGWGGVNLAGLEKAALAAQPKIVNVTVAVPGGQSPYADKAVQAKVSCTGACDIGAYTITKVGTQKPFTDFSSLAHLTHATSKTLSVPYTAKQLTKIGAALNSGRKVSVSVAGAIVDAGGNIERRSAAKRITITR
jgi:subtilase family serine protease